MNPLMQFKRRSFSIVVYPRLRFNRWHRETQVFPDWKADAGRSCNFGPLYVFVAGSER